MNVQIAAPKFDQGTEHVAKLIRPHLDKLSQVLSGEYGGTMDHLWIDLELCPWEDDARDPWPFRFQKRVTPPRDLRELGAKVHFNVGHFSVRPDYFELAHIPMTDVVCHLMRLIYDATRTLETRKQIGNFDVHAFRNKFADFIAEGGCAANKPLQPTARENARSG